MKTVIMAGGRGSRIREIDSEVPKPMIPICGKPILQHQIEGLVRQGFRDIILVIGYLGAQIEAYFGDGSKYGAIISYIREEMPLGTAGALYYLRDTVREDFLLLNGDLIFNVDLRRFVQAHKKHAALVTILTHPNSHPYDSSVIIADASDCVTGWLTKEEERTWYKNRVNAGLHMISPALLERFTEAKKLDLDREVLRPLIAERQLYVYDSPEYVKDMGTPERYTAVAHDLAVGLVEKRSLEHSQRAIFLDRDGTLNRYVGFLTDLNDMELIAGAAEAVRLINASGYLAIVVTNQPVIARGEVSVEELEEIHHKLETLLGNEGAYVDDIFYCPHHPDAGYAGERKEYKKDCDCRKPKPGLLLQAAKKYNIDLRQSWMIGDGENDMQAGCAAGCKVAYLGKTAAEGIPCYGSLLECMRDILQGVHDE